MKDYNNEAFKYYPDVNELDSWIASIWDMAENIQCDVEVLKQDGFSYSLGINHARGDFSYVKFSPKGMDPFYGYWQPSFSQPAPLLFHVPGYGAEISTHPEFVAKGFNVLHVSPLGYATPSGLNERKRVDGVWPVLPDTVTSSAERGYKLWLLDCVLAAKWAMAQPEVIKNRISFFGTSQGGGGALLLGSIFKDKGVRCIAADLPFLTNFPLADWRGAYEKAQKAFIQINDKAASWKALGFIDTLSHARRLDVPVLMTAGGNDKSCPAETIETLFERLQGTRSLVYIKDTAHRYTREFIPLAEAWFLLYA